MGWIRRLKRDCVTPWRALNGDSFEETDVHHVDIFVDAKIDSDW
jgi:hypothetical protein